MTDQQFNAIMDALAQLSQGNKLVWDNKLVGDGVLRPAAPTQIETASNPGKYYGTRYDPLDSIISATPVIETFETIPQAFQGGPVTLWYKRDPEAMKNWYEAKYRVPLDIGKLHPAQKAAMGI